MHVVFSSPYARVHPSKLFFHFPLVIWFNQYFSGVEKLQFDKFQFQTGIAGLPHTHFFFFITAAETQAVDQKMAQNVYVRPGEKGLCARC